MRHPKFLVVEGNVAEVRAAAVAHLGHDAGVDYGKTLVQLADGGTFDVAYPADADAPLPDRQALAEYDGVVIGGSALHLPHQTSEAMRQVELAREIFRSGTPFFGSCWGLQVATVAAGGRVRASPAGRELGIARNIILNENGLQHPLLAGKPRAYDAVAIHLDEVETLPEDSSLLSGNAHSAVQAVEIRHEQGIFWGVQYHPEYSLRHVAGILHRIGHSLVEEGFFCDNDGLAAHAEELSKIESHPERKDLAWKYGLTPDVLKTSRRLAEISNWIENSVRPAMR